MTGSSVALPLSAVFAFQTALTMAAYTIPIAVPIAALSMGLAAESVGLVTSTIYVMAMLSGLITSTLLQRYRASTVYQGLLTVCALGAVVMGLGWPITLFVGAALIGLSNGPMNPTGSHVLARISNRKNRAMIFSIKQCGTPAGGVLAGVALPFLISELGWSYAIMVMPIMLGLLLAAAAPFSQLGPAPPREARTSFSLREPVRAVTGTLKLSAIRAVAIGGMGLAACQLAMATYLPVYLWREVGYSETAAGLTFATLHIAGIVSRIVLGGIADRWVSSRVILIAIAGVMALTLVTIGYFEKDWPMALILLVIFIAGASGNGWVGLFFAELARLSPGDQTASVAAGSQFLMYLGIVGGPAFFGALLGASGSYLFAFYVFGGISLLCGLPLLFTRSPKTD